LYGSEASVATKKRKCLTGSLPRLAKCKFTTELGLTFTLTDVPDSCYRRSGFSVYDSEEKRYGDQSQKVAWEVAWEQHVATWEQEESKEHEVARPVRVGVRRIELTERL
jgi:hypothetical protein